jgi:hypothetical protein
MKMSFDYQLERDIYQSRPLYRNCTRVAYLSYKKPENRASLHMHHLTPTRTPINNEYLTENPAENYSKKSVVHSIAAGSHGLRDSDLVVTPCLKP